MLLGPLGAALSICLCAFGSAYGTVKSASGLFSVGIMKPNMIMKGFFAIIMTGIIGIYGLVVSILIILKIVQQKEQITPYKAGLFFSSGLMTGLGGLASGYGIGASSLYGIKAVAQQEKLLFSYIFALILNEALVIYTLIASLIGILSV